MQHLISQSQHVPVLTSVTQNPLQKLLWLPKTIQTNVAPICLSAERKVGHFIQLVIFASATPFTSTLPVGSVQTVSNLTCLPWTCITVTSACTVLSTCEGAVLTRLISKHTPTRESAKYKHTGIGLRNWRVCVKYTAPGKCFAIIAGKREARASQGQVGFQNLRKT